MPDSVRIDPWISPTRLSGAVTSAVEPTCLVQDVSNRRGVGMLIAVEFCDLFKPGNMIQG